MTRSTHLLGLLFLLGLGTACGAGGGASDGSAADAGAVFEEAEAGSTGLHLLPTDRQVSNNDAYEAILPQVAVWEDTVYVIWLEGAPGSHHVHFNRSLDGGVTWPTTDIRIDRGPGGTYDTWNPQIACEGDFVVIVWEDDRNGMFDIHLNRSDDRGQTWLPSDIRLDQDLAGSADSGYPVLALSEGNAYVAWTEDRASTYSVHFSSSPDGGLTWPISDVQIDMDRADVYRSWIPEITAWGPHVAVTWRDDRVGHFPGHDDIVSRRSDDAGDSWDPVAFVSHMATGSTILWDVQSDRPRDDLVHVVWQDDHVSGPAGSAHNIFYDRSFDAGGTWDDPDRNLTQNLTSGNVVTGPTVCGWGHDVMVSWVRFLPTYDLVLEARRSHDEGQTWSAGVERVLTGPGVVHGLHGHTLSCTPDHVFVLWADDRSAVGTDVYLNYTAWHGSFAPTDLQVNVPPAGATKAMHPDLTTANGQAYAVWADDRTGYLGIYFNRVQP